MHQHLVAIGIHGLVVDNRGQRGPARWPLEPHLRNESCRPISIRAVVDEVPHVPDVNRAVPVIVGMVVLGERVRTSRHVRRPRIQLRHDRREQLRVVAIAPGSSSQRSAPIPLHIAPDVLVSAIPDDQAGMLRKPRHCLPCLRLELAPQRFVLAVSGAREQEVLPDHHAELVAHVVEVVGLVDAAAPYPEQVHPRVHRIENRTLVGRAVEPGQEGVAGCPVRSLDEDRRLVHRDHELAAVVVRLRAHRHRPEPHPPVPAVN